MVRGEAPRLEPVPSLSRKEYLKVKKDETQLFENALLCAITFPKRGFLGKVAYMVHSGAVVPLTVGFGTTAAANPIRRLA
jgi:hypothetical protein